MKKSEVKIGETYRVKVSGSIADVRITGENPHGGWDGVNVITRRKVRIKSAERLRGLTKATSATRAKKTPKAAGKATTSKKADTGERRGKGAKRPSGLDAAAKVLGEAREPLNTKDMVERMLAKGLWKTGGKTPAATIYAAIIREIATKGDKARFRKVDRGRFELAK